MQSSLYCFITLNETDTILLTKIEQYQNWFISGPKSYYKTKDNNWTKRYFPTFFPLRILYNFNVLFYATCTSNTKIYYTQNKICMLNGMKLKFIVTCKF